MSDVPQREIRGVVLAGGTATRLAEATKIANKHTLRVGPWPMIYYALLALQQAGIRHIAIVSGSDHCQQLIQLLGSGNTPARDGSPLFDLDLTYKIQDKPGGIAEAIGVVKDFAEGHRIVVFLGDNIIEGNIVDFVAAFRQQARGARVALKTCTDPQAYGVAVFREDAEGARIGYIEEKPQEPKSSYAVTGIYCYDEHVFDHIERLAPSQRNELEVTDLNNIYASAGELQFNVLSGWWRDAGQSWQELDEIGSLIKETGANKLTL